MAKRILTIVDSSKSGKAASDYTCALAKKYKLNITGMAIIDDPWISSAKSDPLGGVAYRLYHDEEILEGSHNEIEKILDNFKKEAAKAGVKAKSVECRGHPLDEIENVSHEHDLIIMGRTTDFRFQLDEDNDDVVTKVVHGTPRPAIIVPDKYVDKGNVPLIAYDGTFESARALHMFLLLNIYEGKELNIVTITKHLKDAETVIQQAIKLCEAYNIETNTHCIASSKEPSKLILQKAEELNASIIVMGTVNTSALTEVLFGSCTRNLLRKTDRPVFLHH